MQTSHQLPVLSQSATYVSRIGPSGGPEGGLRLRLVGERPDRHSLHDGAGHPAEGAGLVRLRRRERPRPLPRPTERPDRGRPEPSGDRHVLVVDRDACRLWELYAAYPQNGGTSWTAGSGATWSLSSNAMRTLGWTSGDAAGLPILPGLVRYDEVGLGRGRPRDPLHRAEDAERLRRPASHKAGSGTTSDPPMGTWFRLKAGFDISGFSQTNQVILRALKKHGMVVADNGSAWYMSGAPDPALG